MPEAAAPEGGARGAERSAVQTGVMSDFAKRHVNSERNSRRVAALARSLVARVPVRRGERILDVGCGNGAVIRALARELGAAGTGVDLDPDQIARAEAALAPGEPVRFLRADGTALPFDAGAFDVAMTLHATHHVPLWRDALAELVRVLRPGGHLVYVDLVLPRLLARAGALLPSRRCDFPHHAAIRSFFAGEDLAVVYERAGLTRYQAVFRKPERGGAAR